VVADFDSSNDPRFAELLRLADHLIVSVSFARHLTGVATPARAVRALWTSDRQVVVVTCGDAGCWYLNQGFAAPRHRPAFAVKVVDTTGCGDVFHGAYAAGLVHGWPLAERLRFAAAAAALKATRTGGQAGIPSLTEVQAFLCQHHERLGS
jgi:ribokinase